MKITEEMIRRLQAKVDISYEEAEKYLQKAKGDVEVAYLLYKEKGDSFSDRVNTGLGGFLQYRFRISRKGEVMLNLPISIILLIMLLDGIWHRAYVVVFLFIIALIAECEFKIDKYPERKDQDGFTKTNHDKKASNMNASRVNEKEKIIDVASISPEDINLQKELEKVNLVNTERAFRGDESVELTKQEGYNNKDIDKDDDQDNYYEIVIEE